MDDIIDPLVRDFVEWIAKEPRTYRDANDAWRTSCPRLMVWEAATERGYVTRKLLEGQGPCLVATEAGREFVRTFERPQATKRTRAAARPGS